MSEVNQTQSPKPSVQQVLQRFTQWPEHTQKGSYKVLSKIETCRRAEQGYHYYGCNETSCDYKEKVYHSCRNRHCPNCGNSKKEEWIESRLKELLPCKYYHVVFTLPHQLNSIILGNRKELFDVLFDASSYTLLKFAADTQYIGAQPGITSVLHTWGQQLSFHPHVHCIVSGGGTNAANEWIPAKKSKYGSLFPVQALEPVFKAYFLKQLRKLKTDGTLRLTYHQEQNWNTLLNLLFSTKWILYAKQPFGGPQQVVEYLGRYTHKVAISNHRIKKVDQQGNTTFDYKDYSDKNKKKSMTLSAKEFIRRFEQHILPFRYCKIRHYGYLGNNRRKKKVNEILAKMNLPQHPIVMQTNFVQRLTEKLGRDPFICPCCGVGRLVKIGLNQTLEEVMRE
jgi:hypothetical protein